jgi:predicted dehydrogenase
MKKEVKVAVIGLDTSHTIQFIKRMQDPECEAKWKVEGLKAISCMRFETPFQNRQGLDERQKQIEDWGVKVTEDFDEAIQGCDAIMLEINDPAYHLEYFSRCAGLGKPVFLDKPMADDIKSGLKIYELAKKNKTRVFSASSLRFVTELQDAIKTIGDPQYVSVFGPLGIAPAGSSIVWYGVHAFEMLQKAMGRGAISTLAVKDDAGVTVIVEYPDKKRGVVELTEGAYVYGGSIRSQKNSAAFIVDMSMAYTLQLREVADFFRGGEASLTIDDTLEVMDMLDAAERSYVSGEKEFLSGK